MRDDSDSDPDYDPLEDEGDEDEGDEDNGDLLRELNINIDPMAEQEVS
jgi:hypothetical protein